MSICRDIEKLQEPFKGFIKCLLFDLNKAGHTFGLFETLRTRRRQLWLFGTGKSKTLRSLHLKGLACDIVHLKNGVWDWSDIEAYKKLGEHISSYPELEWGGNWKWKDWGHVQLKITD